MKNIQFPQAILKISLWLVGIAAFWLTLAPRQIGGQYIYVIVSGNSMEPVMTTGDLAILHPSEAYQIGDVVIYTHPELGSVIHRVIGVDGDHFIIQGDHNDWIDSYEPTPSEIQGKLWLHIPKAGKVIESFRTPLGASLLAGMLGLFLFWPDRKESDPPE